MDKRSAMVVVFLKEGRAFAGNVWEILTRVSDPALNFLPFNLQVLENK